VATEPVFLEDEDDTDLELDALADDEVVGVLDGPDKGKTKKYIKSTVAVHDRTQIETVFDYYLYRGTRDEAAKARDKTLRYKVEAFLFLPRQFGLDQITYPKDRFYSDVRPLIRFREPKLGFKQMLGLKPGAQSPLVFLKQYIASLEQGQLLEPIQNAVDEVRLFACSYVSNFLRGIDRSRKRMSGFKGKTPAEGGEELSKAFARMTRLLEKSHQVLVEYRALLEVLLKLKDDVSEPLRHEMKLIDEYCYYRFRDGIAYLILMSNEHRSGDGPAEIQAFSAKVAELLAAHDAHAEQAGYMRIQPDSTEALKERFVHRRGELKRRIWEVLFLEIRSVAMLAIQRQTGAMIAAGVAAIWALLAQLYVLRIAMNPRKLNDLWGISGILFVSIVVVAYIVKDRIKDVGRSYFRSGKIPDHSERIWYKDRGGKDVAVGSIKEFAKFERVDKLPERIRSMRERICSGGRGTDESIDYVLRYTKDIVLSSDIKILNRYPLRAVHDILRLNIDACLPRLGEPSRFLNVVANDGEVHAVQFPKVYYLDMALSYSKRTRKGEVEEQALDYFRLVVDKNGLLRTERLE
jgi:hypothetical protein